MYVRVLEAYCRQYVSRESGASRGFTPDRPYKVHKIESYSESGAGFVVLVNDEKEIWWVDNRHVRVLSEDDILTTSALTGAGETLPTGPYAS